MSFVSIPTHPPLMKGSKHRGSAWTETMLSSKWHRSFVNNGAHLCCFDVCKDIKFNNKKKDMVKKCFIWSEISAATSSQCELKVGYNGFPQK